MMNFEHDVMLPRDLIGLEKVFIEVPRDVIRNNDIKVVPVYIYFALKKGMDNTICFTLNHLINEIGYTPDRKQNQMTDKIISSIKDLVNMGYISLDTSELLKKGTNLITATFNEDFLISRIEEISKEGNDRFFARLYIDEIKKILSYLSNKDKTRGCNPSNLFTVFAYLRSKINISKCYKLDKPEAYYEHYMNMAKDIHVSAKTISKMCDILKNDLNLIYYVSVRKRVKDGWFTLPTCFANSYRRYKGKLWEEGEEYSMRQIRKKMELMGEKLILGCAVVHADTSESYKEEEEAYDGDYICLLE